MEWINKVAAQSGNNLIEVADYFLLQRISSHLKHKKASELSKKVFETIDFRMERIPDVF